MANIKCNGKIETQNLEVQSVLAENINANSLSASTITSPSLSADVVNTNAINMEDTSITSNENILNLNALNGVNINSKPAIALNNNATISATLTLSGGTTTRTYTRDVTIVDFKNFAVVSVTGKIDPAYASKQDTWTDFILNISKDALASIQGRGFTKAIPLSFSLVQADGSPGNDYTNSQVQYMTSMVYSDSDGVNINFSWKRYYSENNANHNLCASMLIV